MSGHSKWSTIKRKKASTDAKRGKIFSKLNREITLAARTGGEDITINPRLRAVVLKARANNMPSDTIERAIKKGVGALEGVTYEEIRYEGYGPGGVAIMIDCLTDNRNRTTPEIKTILNKNNGTLGETGSVAYNFDRKGLIVLESSRKSEDEVMELLLDYDIDDIKAEDDTIVVTSTPEGFSEVCTILEDNKIKMLNSEITFIPKATVALDEKHANQCMRLIDLLEDQDDVQGVYSNYDISDEIMMKISEEQ